MVDLSCTQPGLKDNRLFFRGQGNDDSPEKAGRVPCAKGTGPPGGEPVTPVPRQPYWYNHLPVKGEDWKRGKNDLITTSGLNPHIAPPCDGHESLARYAG